VSSPRLCHWADSVKTSPSVWLFRGLKKKRNDQHWEERKIEGEGRVRRGGGGEMGREGSDDESKYENEILIIECVMCTIESNSKKCRKKIDTQL